jgi:flagellar biosynthesis/type III secretory pathway chaperone
VSDSGIPSFEIQALHSLLEKEFEFLKTQDFKAFEGLQTRKQELLQYLLDEITDDSGEPDPVTEEAIRENQTLSDLLIQCRNMQQRNELLISQKLEAIQEVLGTLTYQGEPVSRDTYEHLNKKKR